MECEGENFIRDFDGSLGFGVGEFLIKFLEVVDLRFEVGFSEIMRLLMGFRRII
jgi:hypothetical protein